MDMLHSSCEFFVNIHFIVGFIKINGLFNLKLVKESHAHLNEDMPAAF